MAGQPQLGQRAITLLEMVVVAAIIGILLVVILPFFGGQRGRQAVGTAIDMTESLLSRAQEESRVGGYPIDPVYKSDGLTLVASDSVNEHGALLLRISRRLGAGNPAKIISQRELPNSHDLELQSRDLGQFSAGQQSDFLGVWFEVVRKTGADETTLVSLPVDVNGEFALLTTAKQARLTFRFGDYERNLTLEKTGAFRSD